eukprot:GHVL01023463.1.p1 GENE.GHVL01023463.1~~GHVL01023463.1.p1  ORF type:complete len:839 (-),score=171.47 GHVL01023463.1:92-2608(-)
MTFHFSAHRSTQIDLYSISDSINVSDTPHLSLDVSAEVGCWCPKTNRIAYYDGNKGVCLGSHPSFMDIKVMEESLNRSIKYLHFSNLGKHLAGWSEPKRGEPDDENVFVWDSHTGMLLFSILMRKVFRWPFFKWSSTEHLCCHIDNDDKNILSQSVLVYNGDSISSQPIKKLDIPNVETIELSPLCGGFSAQLAVSLVEISDIMEGDVKLQSVRSQLAKQKFEVIVAIYDLLSTSNDPVTRAVVGDVDSVELLWSCKGTSLLVFYHVEVDSSGKMYGGKSGIHFIRSDGSMNRPLLKRAGVGSVGDVKWNPTREEFIVIHGEMPASVILYDGLTCQPLQKLKNGYRNTIRWNPYGSMVAIGGFGNLAGELDFWWRNSDDEELKLEMTSSSKARFTVDCSWSPDGRLFLCATTFPRRKVDLGVALFKHDGAEVKQWLIPDLRRIEWKPEDSSNFEPPTKPKTSVEAETRQVYRPPRRLQNPSPQTDVSRTPKTSPAPDKSKSKKKNDSKKSPTRYAAAMDDKEAPPLTLPEVINNGRQDSKVEAPGGQSTRENIETRGGNIETRGGSSESRGSADPRWRNDARDSKGVLEATGDAISGWGGRAVESDSRSSSNTLQMSSDKTPGGAIPSSFSPGADKFFTPGGGDDIFPANLPYEDLSPMCASPNETVDMDISIDLSQNRQLWNEIREMQRIHQEKNPIERPNPMVDKCWEYIDPKGRVQGMFFMREMSQWADLGYFPKNLPTRCWTNDEWSTLADMYPYGDHFKGPPMVKRNNKENRLLASYSATNLSDTHRFNSGSATTGAAPNRGFFYDEKNNPVFPLEERFGGQRIAKQKPKRRI